MARGMGERLAVDPNKASILYFGTRTDGLYKSVNSAAGWAKVAIDVTNNPDCKNVADYLAGLDGQTPS